MGGHRRRQGRHRALSRGIPGSKIMSDRDRRPRLILASASPRRHELLTLFRLPFDIVPAQIDEAIHSGESAPDYVARMARQKALAVGGEAGGFVLGADTVVVLDGECLGKPADEHEAGAMLKRLSGRAHRVLSAVALAADGRIHDHHTSATLVEFDDLPPWWIDGYIRSGEPFDKAGAYGIQGAAGIWVKSIAGSYSSVVGLPLNATARLLAAAGLFPAAA